MGTFTTKTFTAGVVLHESSCWRELLHYPKWLTIPNRAWTHWSYFHQGTFAVFVKSVKSGTSQAWHIILRAATLGKYVVEMFKQSRRNLWVNFISSDNEGVYLQVQCAQSGPPVANQTDDAAEQEEEVAGVIPTYVVMDMSKKSRKQADKRPPEYVVVDKSKKKEMQQVAANGTDGAAEQETEVAGKKQADIKPTEYSVVDKSKIKEKQETPTILTYATVDESEKFQEVPPSYAEKDKLIKRKKKIDDKNPYDTLAEQKRICILAFLIYNTAIYHLQI